MRSGYRLIRRKPPSPSPDLRPCRVTTQGHDSLARMIVGGRQRQWTHQVFLSIQRGRAAPRTTRSRSVNGLAHRRADASADTKAVAAFQRGCRHRVSAVKDHVMRGRAKASRGQKRSRAVRLAPDGPSRGRDGAQRASRQRSAHKKLCTEFPLRLPPFCYHSTEHL